MGWPPCGGLCRALRLSGLQLRPALLSEGWSLVYGREPVAEERAASQGPRGGASGALQHGALGRRARSVEPTTARLGELLRLWHAAGGLPSGGQPRLCDGPWFPDTATQGADTRHPALLGQSSLRRAGRAPATPAAHRSAAD